MTKEISFACVEYQTKTGSIWRHTPRRPNYLCDPQKEIDPTSFGCYTSAFAGEHIPLAGLRAGTLFARRRWMRWLRQKITPLLPPSLATNYSLKYFRRFNTVLVIYQFGGDHLLTDFMRRMRKEFPRTVIVTCSSPPWGKLIEKWQQDPAASTRYREFISASHFNMNVVRATLSFYRFAFKTPSLYLPQPYPASFALKTARRRSASRKPVIYVAGDTTRPHVMMGHLVAAALQKRFPRLKIRVTRVPGSPLNPSLLAGARYEVVPFLSWRQQLQALAECTLVINTDMWWTRGRVPADCAAAGVPCVGTGSDAQQELWPALNTANAINLPRLLKLCLRLLQDRSFYEQTVSRAQKRLQEYDYAPTRERLSYAVALARRQNLAAWRDPVWRGDQLILPR